MLLKTLLLLFSFVSLFGERSLQKDYYVDSNEINLSTIIPNIQIDKKIFTITQGKYTKRVKSSQLLELLSKNGYKDFSATSSYVKFTKKSPINTKKINQELIKIYKSRYKKIDIKSVEIRARGYIEALPKEYVVSIQSKNHLKNSGILSIKTPSKKQLFFDYTIIAELDVYKIRKNVKRNTELSHLNCVKKSIILEKFRAMPIQELGKGRLQSKTHLKMDAVLTIRDVRELVLVKRGSIVNVLLSSDNIDISFSGQAMKDAVFGDIIKIKQNNSKVLKIRVVAKGRGEVI